MTIIEPISNDRLVKITEDGYTIKSKDYKCSDCGVPLSSKGKHKNIDPSTECKKGYAIPLFPKELDIKDPLWKLPCEPIKCTMIEAYEAIYGFLKNHIYLTEEIYYHIFTCWIMATYYLELWEAVPYLSFIAPPKSGKSRGLDIISELSYRGFKTGNATASTLFRVIEKWHVTFCLDEAEYGIDSKTENGKQMISLYNDGYKRGGKALRNEKVGDTYEPTPYNVFGFKALASTQLFIPTIFSRCITIYMQKAKVKNKLIDYSAAERIRSMMLYLMYRKLTVFDKELPADGRLEELFIPIYTMTINTFPEKKELLDAYLIELSKEDEEDEKLRLEWKIIKQINSFIENLPNGAPIPIKELAKAILIEPNYTPDDKVIKKISQTVGLKLKTLGIKTKSGSGNLTILDVNENKKALENLYLRYLTGITPPWNRPPKLCKCGKEIKSNMVLCNECWEKMEVEKNVTPTPAP